MQFDYSRAALFSRAREANYKFRSGLLAFYEGFESFIKPRVRACKRNKQNDAFRGLFARPRVCKTVSGQFEITRSYIL